MSFAVPAAVPAAAAPAAARPAVPAWAWVLVLAAALAARLALVAVTPREILFRDGVQFEEVARSIVEHGSYGMQSLRPPGYPTLIAGVYAVFGPNLLALRLVEAVLGTLAIGLIGLVGVSLFGPVAGLLAAALGALNPVLAFLPATQYSENTLLLCTALALGTAFAAWRRASPARWAAAGVLFGICVLVRPNVVLMMPGLAAGFALALRRARRPVLAPALACGLALALTLVPWTLRNHAVHHHWYFVATGGGRQFWFGNNPEMTGATNRLPVPDSTMYAAMWREPDDMGREKVLYARGLAFVKAHPGRAAWLYLLKLRNLFSLYPDTITHNRQVGAVGIGAQVLASLAVFAGALLSLRRLRATPALWPLLGGIVTYALATAVFFTVMRYRVAFEANLLWMAGLGWAGLLGRGNVSR